MVQQVGDALPNDLSTKKTNYLAADLKTWRRTKPKLTDQLETIEQLLQQQSLPPHLQNQSIQKELTHQHHLILTKQETYHRQIQKNLGVQRR